MRTPSSASTPPPPDATGETTNLPSRRQKSKSKSGCRTCKARKVKCDESHPACNNCRRRRVQCDFLLNGIPPEASGTVTPPSLHMLDLELLHHFTSIVFATLSSDSVIRNVWRGPVIETALGCNYLMRTIMAVSALHLAHHHRSNEGKSMYLSTALRYHRMGSAEAMALMSDDSDPEALREHATCLFLFSSLTIFVALSSPRKSAGDGVIFFGESNFPDWLFLIQGTKSLTRMFGPQMALGNTAPYFEFAYRRWNILHPSGGWPPAEPGDALYDLRRLVETTVTEADKLAIYNHSIDELEGILRGFSFLPVPPAKPHRPDAASSAGGTPRPAPLELDVTDAFVWIFEMLDDFLPLLRVPTQVSLAIFAHYCVVLKRLDWQWWMQGWAYHLLDRVYELLDANHRLWIHWPMQEIGWVPPRDFT